LFSLWDTAAGGTQHGPTVPVYNATVTGGLVSVPVDFGSYSYYYFADALWLEVAVRAPAGGGSFTTLSPRQALTATPNALHAQVAGEVEGGIRGGGWPNSLAMFTSSNYISGSNVWELGGQVGIGTNAPEATLDVVGSARAESVQITGGTALQSSVVAWGANNYGQTSVPTPNAGFVAVAAGGNHSLAVKADGSIVAWGSNGSGQCNVPAPNTGFMAAAGGSGHSLGLTADGSIVGWGYNDYGQCNAPAPNTGFVAVAGGTSHSLGLKTDGSIRAWGWNDYGQCNVPAPNTGFAAVEGGHSHSVGLKADGSILAWGSNGEGQCNVPAPNAGFVAVAAGGQHSLGLKADGSIVAWGYNNWGQCNVPAPNTGFVAVAGGWGHSVGLKADGSVLAWGLNTDGQCNVPAPNTGFLTIAVGGGNHSLGLRGTLGTPALQLNVDAAYKPGSSHWTISSDRRLKQKVQPLRGALDRLLGLHGVTFEWRNPLAQGGRFGPQIGLLADEVARVFPAWIGTGPGGYQTLTVSGFEALTAEALRDLRAEKDAQIEALRCENDELRARLARLEELVSKPNSPPERAPSASERDDGRNEPRAQATGTGERP
jgi:hypothetical protein